MERVDLPLAVAPILAGADDAAQDLEKRRVVVAPDIISLSEAKYNVCPTWAEPLAFRRSDREFNLGFSRPANVYESLANYVVSL